MIFTENIDIHYKEVALSKAWTLIWSVKICLFFGWIIPWTKYVKSLKNSFAEVKYFLNYLILDGQLKRLQDLGFRKEDCRRALIHCKGTPVQLSTKIAENTYGNCVIRCLYVGVCVLNYRSVGPSCHMAIGERREHVRPKPNWLRLQQPLGSSPIWSGSEGRERVYLLHRWLSRLWCPSGRAHLLTWGWSYTVILHNIKYTVGRKLFSSVSPLSQVFMFSRGSALCRKARLVSLCLEIITTENSQVRSQALCATLDLSIFSKVSQSFLQFK